MTLYKCAQVIYVINISSAWMEGYLLICLQKNEVVSVPYVIYKD